MQTLQPLYERRFDERSFGFRPRRDRRHALAAAEALTAQGFCDWLVDDIAACFEQVPRPRLNQILARHLPEDVVDLVQRATRSPRRRGLRQGDPLSPLLVNIYLDCVLDKPWRKHHSSTPLLRTADDLLILCRPTDDQESIYEALSLRLCSAGMPLKGKFTNARCRLGHGQSAAWLGYEVALNASDLSVRPTGSSWRNLTHHLKRAYASPQPALAAKQAIEGWLVQVAPCNRTVPLHDLACRIDRVAVFYGFEELPPSLIDEETWNGAVASWNSIRRESRQSVATGKDMFPRIERETRPNADKVLPSAAGHRS